MLRDDTLRKLSLLNSSSSHLDCLVVDAVRPDNDFCVTIIFTVWSCNDCLFCLEMKTEVGFGLAIISSSAGLTFSLDCVGFEGDVAVVHCSLDSIGFNMSSSID